MLVRLLRDEEGQTLVEYALLTALSALVAVAVLTAFGRRVSDVFVTVNTSMVTAG